MCEERNSDGVVFRNTRESDLQNEQHTEEAGPDLEENAGPMLGKPGPVRAVMRKNVFRRQIKNYVPTFVLC